MRILHCCLANVYIDNYGYQENILPKIHKNQGHEVRIIASTETYINNKRLGYVAPSSYFTSDNIPITRIPYTNLLPHFFVKKLRIYIGLTKVLKEFNPDIIFLHDVQFISVKEIAKYAQENDVKIYADSHTDYMNSAKNWVSKNILHKIIYKWCTKKIEPYVIKFWGVTPSRKDFLIDFYNVNPAKVGLLVMGIDDSNINFRRRNLIRKEIRTKLNIDENQFVIITGGKIVKRKNIHLLMEAVNELKTYNLKLIIFGSISDEIKPEIDRLSNSSNILNLGWQNTNDIYDLFFASDLAVFPGAHSVLWEQAVGIGLPAIFKKYKGYEHIDIGGNCIFFDELNIEGIKKSILSVFENKKLFETMKRVALEKGIKEFSYSEIAKKAIEIT